MPTETTDIAHTIGDVLTKLDVALASPQLSDADFTKLRKMRRSLDAAQLKIVASNFQENTKKFQDAADRLSQVNTDLDATIDDVSNVGMTLDTLSNFISAAETLLSIAVPG